MQRRRPPFACRPSHSCSLSPQQASYSDGSDPWRMGFQELARLCGLSALSSDPEVQPIVDAVRRLRDSEESLQEEASCYKRRDRRMNGGRVKRACLRFPGACCHEGSGRVSPYLMHQIRSDQQIIGLFIKQNHMHVIRPQHCTLTRAGGPAMPWLKGISLTPTHCACSLKHRSRRSAGERQR
jgi:hypothetical protein